MIQSHRRNSHWDSDLHNCPICHHHIHQDLWDINLHIFDYSSSCTATCLPHSMHHNQLHKSSCYHQPIAFGGILLHNCPIFNLHNTLFQEQGNNRVDQRKHDLNCGHIINEVMSIKERISECRFCQNMGRGIGRHRICWCCLSRFVFRLGKGDSRWRRLRRNSMPTKGQGRHGRIFGLLYRGRCPMWYLDTMLHTFLSGYQHNCLPDMSPNTLVFHFQHRFLMSKNTHIFPTQHHHKNQEL